MSAPTARRYDLDFVRIFAFGLLIFYHIGMFYVTWDFHVKSVHASSFIEPAMKLVNPWRMSLLFIISGVALRYAVEKAPTLSFLWGRFWRLFLPLAFGMAIIIAPQSFLQLIESGEINTSFWSFYKSYISGSEAYSIIVPTWNHLWYLAYLIPYTFIAVLLLPLIRRAEIKSASPALTLGLTLIPVIIFAIHENWLEDLIPSTHALVDDWGNHALYIPFFFGSFWLAKSEAVWRSIDRLFPYACGASVVLAAWKIFVWSLSGGDIGDIPYIELWALFHALSVPVYAWSCIVLLFGIAKRVIRGPSKQLSYMTQAVFPWYILHQTYSIMAGYWLTRIGIPALWEFIGVTALTIAGCLITYEFIIKRIKPLRPLFGVRLNRVI